MGTDDAVGLDVLKTLVLVLLVANVGFYAWSRGWIDGGAANGDREPERLAKQVRPESIRIVPPGGTEAPKSRVPAAPSAPPAGSAPSAVPQSDAPASAPSISAASDGESLACLQSGSFALAEVPRVEAALHAALPARASS